MQLQIKQVMGLFAALKTPFTVSDTPPLDPIENQVWFNIQTASLMVYVHDTNGNVWVEVG